MFIENYCHYALGKFILLYNQTAERNMLSEIIITLKFWLFAYYFIILEKISWLIGFF